METYRSLSATITDLRQMSRDIGPVLTAKTYARPIGEHIRRNWLAWGLYVLAIALITLGITYSNMLVMVFAAAVAFGSGFCTGQKVCFDPECRCVECDKALGYEARRRA